MLRFFEELVSSIWNRIHHRRGSKQDGGGMFLGFQVTEGQVTKRKVGLSSTRRTTHIAVLGKTGSGKSSLLRHMAQQDIEADHGFLCIDLHGDMAKSLLRAIAAREARSQEDLSGRLIVIEPADWEFSVGLNPLEQKTPDFVRIAEFSEILKRRWGLDHFGARTDELLRNALYVLSANGLTLLELAPLLTHTGFRAQCLKKTPNAEVRQYFEAATDKCPNQCAPRCVNRFSIRPLPSPPTRVFVTLSDRPHRRSPFVNRWIEEIGSSRTFQKGSSEANRSRSQVCSLP